MLRGEPSGDLVLKRRRRRLARKHVRKQPRPERRLGRLVEGADRQMIENKLAVPPPRAASKRIGLDILRRRTKLAGEVRDHGRRGVRFFVGKTTLRALKRQLTGEPEPAGIGIADDKHEVIGRQRPAFIENGAPLTEGRTGMSLRCGDTQS